MSGLQRHEGETDPRGVGPGVGLSRQSGLKVRGGPHKISRLNYPWGILDIDNCGEPIHWLPFGHWGNLLCASWSTWTTSSPIQFHDGTVWTSQTLLFQLSSKVQLGLCAIFTRVSDHARVSLTAFGERYTEQCLCFCLHKYRALHFSPINWTKYKS